MTLQDRLYAHPTSRGFTLIELLVVIAIIGILSSVVLASLNSSRLRGADAAIKSNLHNMRSQAELFYNSSATGAYTGVCTDGTTGIQKGYNAAVAVGGNGGACADAATYWVAWAGLKQNSAQAWCVDNTGNAKAVTKPVSAITVCP